MEVDPEPYLGQLDDFVGIDHKVCHHSIAETSVPSQLSISIPLYFRESPAPPYPDSSGVADPAGAGSGAALAAA